MKKEKIENKEKEKRKEDDEGEKNDKKNISAQLLIQLTIRYLDPT